MFKHKDKNQARQDILNMVSSYYQHFHQKPDYKEGDRISYASRIYDQEEMKNLVDTALTFWLTSEAYTQQFENKFADFIGCKYCSLVNSGSSANLLAFMALTAPELDERCIRPGDEVITVAAAFPTTVTPIIQYGAIPVFVDVEIPQYNIDVSKLEQAYSSKTKAVMIAHTMGNPFDIQSVKSFCDKYNLWLIEDNCDALGSLYSLNGKEQKTGAFGDIATSSFYPPHHMTMGEGGAVYTNNSQLNQIIRSMRDWGRDCVCETGEDNRCGNRFGKQYGELPLAYDHKYVYSHFGYNLKATDMQAAIGVAQLEKLPKFIAKRRENFDYLYKNLQSASDLFILPEPQKNATPSWFGFLLTCKKGIHRESIINYLENKKIQTRMLFSGNLIKHPCFNDMRLHQKGYRVVEDLTETDRIMNDTFWVGTYPGLQKAQLDYIIDALKKSSL